MSVEILYGCFAVGLIAMFLLFLGFLNEGEHHMQDGHYEGMKEVKVFGRDGKLKKVITPKELEKTHWHRFNNSTRFGDKKNRSLPKLEEEVSIQE